MMTDDQILEVVTAHKEGKKVEIQEIERPQNGWFVKDYPPGIIWDFAHYRYRVAPEPGKPREWWIHPKTFPDVEFEKDRILTEQPLNPAWIHVVEVLND